MCHVRYCIQQYKEKCDPVADLSEQKSTVPGLSLSSYKISFSRKYMNLKLINLKFRVIWNYFKIKFHINFFLRIFIEHLLCSWECNKHEKQHLPLGNCIMEDEMTFISETFKQEYKVVYDDKWIP